MSVRSRPDTNTLGNAVSRPGIDPRVWVIEAVVMALGFDAEHGTFVDVQYQPTGELETCRVGSMYTADEGGFHVPFEIGDTVLVAVPSGDSNNGPVIISQLWGKQQPPAKDAGSGGEPSKDILLRVRKGRKMKIVTADGDAGKGIGAPGIRAHL